MKVLLLGGSGQVGGALLSQLSQDHPDIHLTVFLRTQALDTAIQKLNPQTTILHGDLDTDSARISTLVSTHDLTINAANSRDADLTRAILSGAATHRALHGSNTILLHLSGAGNFSDNSTLGTFHQPSDPFTDTNRTHVQRINASMPPNGASDELILHAASQGLVNAYFVTPGGIYGASASHIGHLADTERGRAYAGARGVWAGWMLRNIADLGFSPYIGPGTSVFPVVHVNDVVSLTLRVLDKAVRIGQAYRPEDVLAHYYLGVGAVVEAKELATLFAGAAYRLGLIDGPEVRSVPYEGAGGYVVRYLAGNIDVRAENARLNLGWVPKGPSLGQALEEL